VNAENLYNSKTVICKARIMPFDRIFADKLVRPNCTYFMKLNPLARSITGAARDEPHPL